MKHIVLGYKDEDGSGDAIILKQPTVEPSVMRMLYWQSKAKRAPFVPGIRRQELIDLNRKGGLVDVSLFDKTEEPKPIKRNRKED